MPPKAKKTGTFLTRAKSAHQIQPVKVPGMEGEEVFAKSLSASAIRRITEACRIEGKEADDPQGYDDQKLVTLITTSSIVDKSGNPLIPVEECDELDELPNLIKLTLQQAAMKANGMGEAAAGGND